MEVAGRHRGRAQRDRHRPDRGQLPECLPRRHRPPPVSNLNHLTGQAIPNLVLVSLGPGNTITLYNMCGTVDVLGDLVGYAKCDDHPARGEREPHPASGVARVVPLVCG
jgi:hypothetical protein